jgi:large subunit ribosomal protein L15
MSREQVAQMTRLNELRDNPGSSKNRIRVGRGIGSGKGKTGGRGGKGQTARSGVAINGFEGGQMPLHMRMPKRGFNVPNVKSYNAVRLDRIQTAIDAGKLDATNVVDAAALVAAGVIRRAKDGVRLINAGEFTAKTVSFNVIHASAGAVAAIEAAGGKVETIEQKVWAKPARA